MSNIISSKLDANQITRLSFDEANQAMKSIGIGGSLVPDKYTSITLTYVGATTDINTVTYFDGATQICTLTLGYDGSNRLTSVTRT